ncbi:hypothetical protein [Paraburkholderia sp.]
MSPFCLINVAKIRDHAAASPVIREAGWQFRLKARLTQWMTHLRRVA